MAPTPAIPLSDEVVALFNRAEHASAEARRLLEENDRWRRRALAQFDYMFELGAEFRKPGRNPVPRKVVPGGLSAPGSASGAVPIP